MPNEESLAYLAPIGGFLVSVGPIFSQLLAAYRTGGGVPFADYGTELRDMQGAFNRPAFSQLLATEWLANGAPDVHARLQASPPARPGRRVRIRVVERRARRAYPNAPSSPRWGPAP